MRTGAEALARLVAPAPPPRHLLCDPSAAGGSLPHLLAMLSEPGSRTALILVSRAPPMAMGALNPGQATLPADIARLTEALAAPRAPCPPQHGDAVALAAGLTNGEIAVHYQPVVRLADRRPVMVEALARWHRPPTGISPNSFVPLAESSGLARALSILVASRAAAEIAPLWQALRLGVSVNLPLGLLLQADLPAWLQRALRAGGLHPAKAALELTETTEVQDRSSLRRALLRLREAGHRVLLDDIVLHDDRDWLLGLPFGAFKLDRSLVERLPADAHARREVRRLVRLAGAGGKQVIAEGVSDRRLWDCVRALGVDHAQGYLVGRPLPAAALRAWSSGWRGRPPPR